MADFRKLRVWRTSHALALNIDRLAHTIRGNEYASLRSQLIRSAMSIPANIVEGREKNSDPDFCRFLRYALNSTSELEYHLIVARDIKQISPSDFLSAQAQAIDVRKMLYGLITLLSGKENRSNIHPYAGSA